MPAVMDPDRLLERIDPDVFADGVLRPEHLSVYDLCALAGIDPYDELTAAEVRALESGSNWRLIARPQQLAPDGEWDIWVILGGRGAGKTRPAAEWTAEKSLEVDGSRCALVAPTFADGRDVLVEGESGLLACLPPSRLINGSVEDSWNRSMGELTLADDAYFRVFSSQKPDRLRGPQFHLAWVDEFSSLLDAPLGTTHERSTFQLLLPAVRLNTGWRNGKPSPQVVMSSTPKNNALTRELLDPDSPYRVVLTRMSSLENIANLAPVFIRNVIAPRIGTRLGRQEVDGLLVEDYGDVFNTSRIRWTPIPDLKVSSRARYVDLAATEPHDGNRDPDWTATLLINVDHKRRQYQVEHGTRFRLAPGRREEKLREIAEADRAAYGKTGVRWYVEIEPGSGGKSQFHTVAVELDGIVPVHELVLPKSGKAARAEFPAAAMAQRRISVVTGWEAMHAFVEECTEFRDDMSHPHDDLVDCLSGVFVKPPPKPVRKSRGHTGGATGYRTR
ncbi:MAG: hypothetical protein AAGA90_21560 [Actinomycetota bacterium]